MHNAEVISVYLDPCLSYETTEQISTKLATGFSIQKVIGEVNFGSGLPNIVPVICRSNSFL
jgi:hypothetical protein